MKNLISVILAAQLAALAVSCSPGGSGVTASTLSASQQADAPQVPARGTGTAASGSACSPIPGEGTIDPAISISSLTFRIDDLELTLSEGDLIPAPAGSEVRVVKVEICVGAFMANGGEACVDFAPTSESGEEIIAEHAGTHMVPLAPGLISLTGPDRSWSIEENWVSITAVVNHWPGVKTEDQECAAGQCERDYQMVLPLR